MMTFYTLCRKTRAPGFKLVFWIAATLFLLSSICWAGPAIRWETSFDGSSHDDDIAKDIVADDQGNTYLTGSASQSVVGSYINGDIVTMKIDYNGNIDWVEPYPYSGGHDEGRLIEIDPYGNIVVAANGDDPAHGDIVLLKYDPGGSLLCSAVYSQTTGAGAVPEHPWDMAIDGDANILIAGETGGYGTNPDWITLKYNADCVLEWAHRYDGPTSRYDAAYGIAVDSTNAVIVTGYSDLGTSQSDPEYVTIKYSPGGAILWNRPSGSDPGDFDVSTDVAVDHADNIFVTGGSRSDYMTIKYDPSGAKLWQERFDLNRSNYIKEEGARIVLDDHGDAYIAGGGGPHCATFKYDSGGHLQWYELYAGPGGGPASAVDIAIDKYSNVYVTGHSGRNSNKDFVTIKYDRGGVQMWSSAAQYDNPDHLADTSAAIALDCEGGVYVTGSSQRLATKSDITTIKYGPSVQFLRGDANCDGKMNYADTLSIWDIVNGVGSTCPDAADINDDGSIDIDDVTFSWLHVANGSPTPGAPFPTPGLDPTPDCLDCQAPCRP